jgi:hypothetical protein
MIRRIAIGLILLLAGVMWTAAQTATPGTGIGPVTNVTLTPTNPPQSDPRYNLCSASRIPGFSPHIVRAGDRLADLLAGYNAFSLAQIAALNCLDDPAVLPVGGVLWLPEGVPLATIVPKQHGPKETQFSNIRSLTASASAVQNQQGVTFTWDAEGLLTYFYPCSPQPTAPCNRPSYASPLPLQYTTPPFRFQYAGPVRYRLEAVNGDATTVKDVTVMVTCTHEWLGPMNGSPVCPADAPLRTFGAWQPYENGLMMWFGDTHEIWVMNNDGHFQIFPDTYVNGEPDPADKAPEGKITPTRGFGKVWSQMGGRKLLGWAWAKEVGIDVLRQAAGRNSYTTFITGPGRFVYAVTRIPGEPGGYWTQVVR